MNSPFEKFKRAVEAAKLTGAQLIAAVDRDEPIPLPDGSFAYVRSGNDGYHISFADRRRNTTSEGRVTLRGKPTSKETVINYEDERKAESDARAHERKERHAIFIAPHAHYCPRCGITWNATKPKGMASLFRGADTKKKGPKGAPLSTHKYYFEATGSKEKHVDSAAYDSSDAAASAAKRAGFTRFCYEAPLNT